MGINEMSIRIGGKLYDFARPWVMGIVNVTPDSFYQGSRMMSRGDICRRVEEMLKSGADCLDVGGYSSRPGCEDIPEDEEWRRLDFGLGAIRDVGGDEVIISVDTFRAEIARRSVEQWGVGIINDISGATLDEKMLPVAANLGVAYVLMHLRGNPQTMSGLTDYEDVTSEVISDLAFKLDHLHDAGIGDVIIDPGFGFAKNLEQNFTLLAELKHFGELGCPILAGLSRKSMIWRTLGITPEESLNGTTALNMAALMNGANILRVHDVGEGRECVKLFEALNIK